ncbi:MAG: hypothetical protein Q8P05_02975 [Candidatus Diapherotrites archaeon]|nr:hypothetical protein [Candidatus Diapherotrites archaeon]
MTETPTHEITFLDPLTAGKVNAVFGLVAGLITGIVTLITSGILSTYLQTQTWASPEVIATAQQAGFIGLLLFLVLGIITGFLAGFVGAYIFNFTVKLVGGVKVGVKDE